MAFLAPGRRHREFTATSPVTASVKHLIAALCAPHTEVELVLLNGLSVACDRRLADNERAAVHPVFEAIDLSPLLRVCSAPLRHSRFITDAHRVGLARLLRMSGFDTRTCDRCQRVFREGWHGQHIDSVARGWGLNEPCGGERLTVCHRPGRHPLHITLQSQRPAYRGTGQTLKRAT